jgi:hypothetical protein
MTPKQLGIKARQLYSRKRLIETVEGLEEAIKTFMTLEGKGRMDRDKNSFNGIRPDLGKSPGDKKAKGSKYHKPRNHRIEDPPYRIHFLWLLWLRDADGDG